MEGSLKRLNTDYIDILLLHRPDTLMEPEEVAEAFNALEQQGKVRYFGVSNQNPAQIELLNHYCGDKIIVNQLQLSIPHCHIIDAGLNVKRDHSQHHLPGQGCGRSQRQRGQDRRGRQGYSGESSSRCL